MNWGDWFVGLHVACSFLDGDMHVVVVSEINGMILKGMDVDTGKPWLFPVNSDVAYYARPPILPEVPLHTADR